MTPRTKTPSENLQIVGLAFACVTTVLGLALGRIGLLFLAAVLFTSVLTLGIIDRWRRILP